MMRTFTKCWLLCCGIFILIITLPNEKVLVEAILMPAIVLDSRNPIFNCPSRQINTVLVKMRDHISLHCPTSTGNLGQQNSYVNYVNNKEIMYFITEENKQDALTCNVTGYSNSLLSCDDPLQTKGRKVRINSMSGDATAPLFTYGKTYYIIGVGDGTAAGLTNKVGGRCNTVQTSPETTYKMILKIRVCSEDEENVYNNCTTCKTIGCYNQGCGVYDAWQDWQYFRNISQMRADSIINSGNSKEISELANENKCIRRRRRTCSDKEYGCDGPNEEVEVASCPTVTAKPNHHNCSSWMTLADLYRNSTNACFVRSYRNCTVGNLEKMSVGQWKIDETTCPVTTPAPCKNPVCGNWKSSNMTYTNATGHCFALHVRECVLPIPSCKSFNITERLLRSISCPNILSTSSISLSTSVSSAKKTSPMLKLPMSTTMNSQLPSQAMNVGTTVFTKTIFPRKTVPSSNAVFTRITPATHSPCSAVIISTVLTINKCTKAPDPGKSTGEDNARDVTKFVIPCAAFVVGVLLGTAISFFAKRRKKIRSDESYLAKDSEIASNEAGIANEGYQMNTLRKSTTPVA